MQWIEGRICKICGRSGVLASFFHSSQQNSNHPISSLPNGFGATHALDDTVEFEDSCRWCQLQFCFGGFLR